MSNTRFRVNPHSIVAWMSRTSLLEAGAKSELNDLAKLVEVFIYKLSSSGFESSCSHLNIISWYFCKHFWGIKRKLNIGSLKDLKHLFLDIIHNRCSWKFRNIHRKTPVLEPLFNKVADLKACNCINKRLQHRCFFVNIAKFSRTAFLSPLVAASESLCPCVSHNRVFEKNCDTLRCKTQLQVEG